MIRKRRFFVSDINMKWWGWGNEKTEFDVSGRPLLWPYISEQLGLELNPRLKEAVTLEGFPLKEPSLNPQLEARLRQYLKTDQIKTDKKERIVHSYGKSYRDLLRINNGQINRAPDVVIYPESDDDIAHILSLAEEYKACVIPFGGGSNIVGSVEPTVSQERTVLTLDMKRMNKVLSVDRHSMTATIQAGALGPVLEEQLNRQGLTLGHFPDSFQHSSLGGWLATRSAGMQSDHYGNVEDMVLSISFRTLRGTLVTRPVPRSSSGPDLNEIILGSEGTMGIIVQATMRVRLLPEHKDYRAFLFPSFESGSKAVHEIIQTDIHANLMRLYDPKMTELSVYSAPPHTGLKSFISKLIKAYLRKRRSFDFSKTSLMILGFEGSKNDIQRREKKVFPICKKHGGFPLGTEPGKRFFSWKYDYPYLRDWLMKRAVLADVSETSTVWSNFLNLYTKTIAGLAAAIEQTGQKPWVGCHMSHSYKTGTSLYFTFACRQKPGDELNQYSQVKKAAEDSFLKNGGTVSHHHAIGYEHMPWILEEKSPIGIEILTALKKELDPNKILNPDKIIPPPETLKDKDLAKKS
jgi:alkyldihydroxyacetonephosphate synthase